MYIPRRITQDVLELVNYFPVVGIIGPRQIGKTTLAKVLMEKTEKPCLYLDLELQEDFTKLSNPELYLEQHLDKCIILDELQRMPDLLPILRGLIDRKRIPGRFMILGSASPTLLTVSSETLAGRIAYKELTMFNLTEIQSSHSMWHHWFQGGFPEAFLAPSEKLFKLWIRNFIQTYAERDLQLLGMTASHTQIKKLWTMLAHFHGGIMNSSSFANALGVTLPTVNRYINFLEEAFLIRRLQPFFLNLKKRLVKSPKVYIRDSGILHSLIGIQNFESLQGYVNVGASWEGYVIEQITQLIDNDITPYYYRTHAGTESDLILARGNQPLCCIEIKYTTAPKIMKGFQIAIDDLKTSQNFIIVPKAERFRIHEKIQVCSLLEFLSEYLPKI